MLIPDNPRGHTIVVVSIADAIISPIVVTLRLVARYKSRAGYGVDDYWITFALVPVYGMLICCGFCKCLERSRSKIAHG